MLGNDLTIFIELIEENLYFITAFKKTPAAAGDELNADISSFFRGDPALKERGGCHRKK